MPEDITMCADVSCPSRKSCYRFMVIPSPIRQSYGDFHRNDNDDKCDYYINMWENYDGSDSEG